jgi:hypothetical protein
MGQVHPAGKETQQRTALSRDMIADRAAQHWIASLERVKHRTLGGLTLDVDLHLTADLCQYLQMRWKLNSNHGNVWTSTDWTDGRSRTMSAQVSPLSADAYTWPPVVPKYTPHESSESMAIASRNTLT